MVTGFAGARSAFSLASRASFDFVIDHDTMAEPAAKVLVAASKNSDLLVSIQNAYGAQLAADVGIPCAYIDTLLWMWPEPPDISSAARCFVVWFPGFEARLDAWKNRLPEPELVSPLTSRLAPSQRSNRTNVVVNFGGLSSQMIPAEDLLRYAAIMTECVTAAVSDWRGSITVCAGAHVLSKLSDTPLQLSRQDVVFADLDHRTYLNLLQGSAVLISSAGLHAVYEASELGVPCVLLPAQNLSQALAIPTYREYGLPCLDWDSFYSLDGLSPAEEQKACDRIALCVARFRTDGPARSRLVEHLRWALEEDQLVHAREAQGRFTEPFTERGAYRISRYVLDSLPT